jgi:hypothetical protein
MNKLFKGVAKDLSNADIGWMHDKSPFYNEGYKTAARELSTDYEKRDTKEKDTLVFPIIFLYRQYIELTLKDLIRETDLKLNFQRNDKILENHALLPLWDEAIKQYEEHISVNNITLVFTPTIKKERSIVNQFNQIDGGSFSFRYATDKQGNDYLNNIDYISVNNFKSQIETVVVYLEKMIETLCDYT